MRISKLCLVVCAVTLCAASPTVRADDNPAQAAARAALEEQMRALDMQSAPTNAPVPAPATPAQPAQPAVQAPGGDKSAGDGNQSSSRARGNDANNERNECTAGPAAGGSHALRGNHAAAHQPAGGNRAGDDSRSPRCSRSNDRTGDVIGFEFGE